MPLPFVTSWRYHLPNDNHEGWAIVFLDSIGCFSALSDYGNYGHRWPMAGWGPGDFRKFFIDCYDDYILGKIAPRDQYDGEATIRSVEREILEARRSRTWSREQARDEWNLLGAHGDLWEISDFNRWYARTTIEDAWEHHQLCADPQAVAFVKRVLPRLRDAIRQQLRDEAEVHERGVNGL